MTDHRQSVYTVRLGDLSAEVRGFAGLCDLLPPDAAMELSGRRASFYVMLSAGGGRMTLRLAAIPGAEINVTRVDKTARYLIEVWRGKMLNSRTIDPTEPVATWETDDYLRELQPEVAAIVEKRLPSVRSRLSKHGEAYIQAGLADGLAVGIRITRKG